jgi:small subunit ribosomal protein S9
MRVNKRDLSKYFCNETQRTVIRYPLTITDNVAKFDVRATVMGGGVSGQAGAIRLGIAKALLEFNTELRPRLKRAGLLTRDSRIKERKKYGQKGARKRFQFSKR